MRAAKVEPEIDAKIRTEVAELVARFNRREDLSRETATLLFFRYGLYPSVQLVHGYTRRGSLTDVNKDLGEFWKSIRDKARVRIDGVGLPDDLLAKVADVMSSLWQLAQVKADESLEKLRDEARAEADAARSDAAQAAELRRLAEDRTEAALQEAKAAHSAREEAERLLAIERAAKASALEQVDEWQSRAQAEAAARQQSEQQFASNLEAQRQAHRRTEERLEGEVRFAKLQIDEARELSRILQERIKAMEADRTLVEAQLRKQNNALLDEVGESRLALGELRGKLTSVTDERDRLAARVDDLLNKIQGQADDQVRRLRDKARDAARAAARAELLAKPHAFELRELLECELLFDEAAEEQDLLYLGQLADEQLGQVGYRATPSFKDLDALEVFCAKHMERYQAMDIEREGVPATWFWEKT